jgi:hypothetical protein
MMELDVAALRAPAAILRDERTLPPIPLPHGALDPGRNGARSRLRRAARPRLRGGRERLPIDFVPQQLQCPGDDQGGIAVRDLAAQSVLQVPEVVVGILAHGDLETVAFRRQRRHHCAMGWHRQRLHDRRRLGRFHRFRRCGDGRNHEWLRGWELPDRRRHVRLRRKACHDHLDFPVAAVPRFRENGQVVLPGQDRPEKLHRGHVHRAVGQSVEDDRKPADGAGGRHAVVGGVVGQAEVVEAALVHRSPTFAEVCLAREKLRKVGDELNRSAPGGRQDARSDRFPFFASQPAPAILPTSRERGDVRILRRVRAFSARGRGEKREIFSRGVLRITPRCGTTIATPDRRRSRNRSGRSRASSSRGGTATSSPGTAGASG